MNKDYWKQRREMKDAVGVDALKKTISDYEEKLCKLHTENLNIKQCMKIMEDTYKIEVDREKSDKNKANEELKNAYHAIHRKEEQLKNTKKAIDLVDKAMQMDWLNRFFRLRNIDKAVQIIVRGW